MSALRQQVEPFLRDELGCRCPDEVLEKRFSALAGNDGRAHLHVVAPAALPSILVPDS